MALNDHQIRQLHAYADDELGVDASLEVLKLIEENAEAKSYFENICQLKKAIKATSDAGISSAFAAKLSEALKEVDDEQEVRRSVTTSIEAVKRAPVSQQYSWVAAAIIVVLTTMFYVQTTNGVGEIAQQIDSRAEYERRGEDVMKYIVTAHHQMMTNDGPMYQSQDLSQLVSQINSQWKGEYTHKDFDIKASYQGYCLCSVPGSHGSKRISYKIDLEEGAKGAELVSLYILNGSEEIKCNTFKEEYSNGRTYLVGFCPDNFFKVIQWKVGDKTYFMVGMAPIDELVNLMDQILIS